MLLKTAYENVDRCLRRAECERNIERRRAWLYTARLWRRLMVEIVLLRPDEINAEMAKIREIEAEASALGTSLRSKNVPARTSFLH